MFNFFAKRKLIRQFSEYLDPESVRDLLDGRALDTTKIQAGRIEFLFVFVRADSPQQLAERIGLVADAGIEHEAVVHDLIGPMVVMAFGTVGATQHSPVSRPELVGRLQRQFGADIKIVHGAADGHFGNFGGDRHIAFTFTFPRFDTALATLGRLEFGQTEELLP
jgi:hypothetical protein